MSDSWLTVREAMAASGVSESTVRRWVKLGQVKAATARPLKVSEESMRAHLAEEARWITWAEACELVGCSEPTLARMILRGQISSRDVPRGVASLNLLSVERAVVAWQEARLAATKRREEQRERSSKSAAPDREHVWVSTKVTADVLGVTPSAVRQRVAAGKLPGVVKAGKLWLRRDVVEVAAAARAFAASRAALEGRTRSSGASPA